MGNSLALYNPPTRVAEEYAYIDCLSGGRLIAGFVLGTPMDSVFAYGMPPIEMRERFEEARQLILRAWTEPEPFAFNGKYNKLRYVNIWPRPIQKRIPIWVPGGGGSVETWDLVNEHDYCYGHLSFSGLYSSKPLVDGFWEYLSKHNGNMNPHRMAFTQIVCLADTEAEAERKYYEAVRYFHRNSAPGNFANPPGYTTVRSMKAASSYMSVGKSKLTTEDRVRASRGEMSFWEYDEKGYIIAGTPQAGSPAAARTDHRSADWAAYRLRSTWATWPRKSRPRTRCMFGHAGGPVPARSLGRSARPLDARGKPGAGGGKRAHCRRPGKLRCARRRNRSSKVTSVKG